MLACVSARRLGGRGRTRDDTRAYPAQRQDSPPSLIAILLILARWNTDISKRHPSATATQSDIPLACWSKVVQGMTGQRKVTRVQPRSRLWLANPLAGADPPLACTSQRQENFSQGWKPATAGDVETLRGSRLPAAPLGPPPPQTHSMHKQYPFQKLS